MISCGNNDRPYLNADAASQSKTFAELVAEGKAKAWLARIASEAARVPQPNHTREALENIAYDCASLEDAQNLAREALRKS